MQGDAVMHTTSLDKGPLSPARMQRLRALMQDQERQ